MGKQISISNRRRRSVQPPNRDVSKQLLKCFGATNNIFSLLAPGEVIQLQQLDKWQYVIGVSRC